MVHLQPSRKPLFGGSSTNDTGPWEPGSGLDDDSSSVAVHNDLGTDDCGFLKTDPSPSGARQHEIVCTVNDEPERSNEKMPARFNSQKILIGEQLAVHVSAHNIV